jgi:hypothetical protein
VVLSQVIDSCCTEKKRSLEYFYILIGFKVLFGTVLTGLQDDGNSVSDLKLVLFV